MDNNYLQKTAQKYGLKAGVLNSSRFDRFRAEWETELNKIRSFIVFLQPYPELEQPEFGRLGKQLKISKYARGYDYHNILQDKLDKVSLELKRTSKLNPVWVGVDDHPLPEKQMAVRAGMGQIGYNTLLVNSALGSYTFIGLIGLTDPLSEEFTLEPENINCAGCRKCQAACPGQALDMKDGRPFLHRERCISYLTQKKGILSKSQAELIGDNFWGCDICQEVCPYNHFEQAVSARKSAARTWPEISSIDPGDIIELYLDDKENIIGKQYANYAFSWRGARTLVRNLLITLTNLQSRSYQQEIQKLNSSNSPIIQHYLQKYLEEI
ncbi:MAG: epoxyqueuosine reductase [Bacillota bacterium]